MRHMHHHPHPHFHGGFRPGYWRRPYYRPGRLLGLIGLTALGYSLLNRKRYNQPPQNGTVYNDPNREW